jgi:hypothetical protein
VHVLKAVTLETFYGPLDCRAVVRRVGDAGTVDIGDVEEVFHNLRVLEGLSLDVVKDTEVDLFGCGLLRRHGKCGKQESRYNSVQSHF